MKRSCTGLTAQTTVTEAAQRLRAFADALVSLEEQGWELDGPVEDDCGWISRRPLPRRWRRNKHIPLHDQMPVAADAA